MSPSKTLAGLRRNGHEPRPVAADRPRLPYPNGWFAVAFSEEVPPGRVLRRRLMGEDVVIYRTRGGVVRVIEPYCPHLGAHLGYGGRVEGEEIVCPFHGFRFDTSGACVANSYATRPPRAQLSPRIFRELNGAIVVWRDADGGAPTWELPRLPNDGFPAAARRTYTIVDHPQEVMENAVDIGHIQPVHGYQNPQIRTPIHADGPHLRIGTVAERVFPVLGNVEMLLDFEIDGLGFIWVLAKIPRFGGEALFQAWPTPIDPCRIDLRFAMSLRVLRDREATGMAVSRLLTSALASAFWSDLTKDFPIWENKQFVARPRLAKGDGPIIPFRNWARQFYSDGAGDGGLTSGVREAQLDRV
jgi:phenylpropionate dioxygenase-like ring-hydroxylating dioxygenase large terminal subunit